MPLKQSLCLILPPLLLVACRGPAEHASGPVSASDWQTTCEAALDTATPAPINTVSTAEHRRELTPDLAGSITGMAYDSVSHHLLVIDHGASSVIELDQQGKTLRTFGRDGDGPGEFRFDQPGGYRGNRLVLLGDSAFAVLDARAVKLFTRNGRFIGSAVVDSNIGGSYEDASLAYAGAAGLITTRTGRWRYDGTGDSVRQARLDLVTVQFDGKHSTQRLLGSLQNSTAAPGQQSEGAIPYRGAYHRSWGYGAGEIVAVSFRLFGICRFDLAGHLQRADALAAKRLEMDAAERQQVLDDEQGGGHTVMPFIHVTGEEYYRGHWPDAGPLYTDIVVSPDGTAWARRRMPHGKAVVDVYSPTAGYQGTFPAQDRQIPALLRRNRAYSLEQYGMVIVDQAGSDRLLASGD